MNGKIILLDSNLWIYDIGKYLSWKDILYLRLSCKSIYNRLKDIKETWSKWKKIVSRVPKDKIKEYFKTLYKRSRYFYWKYNNEIYEIFTSHAKGVVSFVMANPINKCQRIFHLDDDDFLSLIQQGILVSKHDKLTINDYSTFKRIAYYDSFGYGFVVADVYFNDFLYNCCFRVCDVGISYIYMLLQEHLPKVSGNKKTKHLIATLTNGKITLEKLLHSSYIHHFSKYNF